jgi:uncharacterized protein YbaA (DUF1428 family)
LHFNQRSLILLLFKAVAGLSRKEEFMAKYIDSFVIPVPKKKLRTYRAFAKKSAKIWTDHGALEYVESVADDAPKGKITSFPRSVKLKSSETVVFAYVTYTSRKHRDRVHDKVMQDPRMRALWDEMPFDGMRMIWGGFSRLVSRARR